MEVRITARLYRMKRDPTCRQQNQHAPFAPKIPRLCHGSILQSVFCGEELRNILRSSARLIRYRYIAAFGIRVNLQYRFHVYVTGILTSCDIFRASSAQNWALGNKYSPNYVDIDVTRDNGCRMLQRTL